MVSPIQDAIITDAEFAKPSQILGHISERLTELGMSSKVKYFLTHPPGNRFIEFLEIALERGGCFNTIGVAHDFRR